MTAPRTLEDWRALFSARTEIVLVANSGAAHVAPLVAARPGALFVFFNKVDRVLDTAFPQDALLVTRCNPAGSELIYRGTLPDVLRLLPKAGPILALRAAERERAEPAEAFALHGGGTLDLSGWLSGVYPADHTASSGFALALWLAEQCPETKVTLAGFTGTRSEAWKVFHVHDWSFEQTVLRLLAGSGRIAFAEPRSLDRYAGLRARFPELGDTAIALAAAEVQADRLESANRMIDRLLSVTAPLRAVAAALKRLKPRTRKQRLMAKQARGTSR